MILLGMNKLQEEISLAGTVRNFSGPRSLVDVQHCGTFLKSFQKVLSGVTYYLECHK
jgi:hypothetical protein